MNQNNPFNDLAGAQSKSNVNTRYTGLAPVIPICVNPTFDRLCEVLEIENKENAAGLAKMCNYDIRTNPNTQRDERPVVVWVYSPQASSYVPITFNISNGLVTSKNGDKFRYINKRGQISYFATSADEIANNPKVTSWFSTEGLREIVWGEAELYTWIQKLIRYDASVKGANFLNTLEQAGVTADNLYNGDVSGVQQLIDYATANANSIIMLHVIKEKETDNGPRYYQELLLNTDVMFRNGDKGVVPSMHDKVYSIIKDKEQQGYNLTTRLFTIEFQEFSKNDCYGQDSVPQDTASPASTGWV